MSGEGHAWRWYQYDYDFRALHRTLLTGVYGLQDLGKTDNSRVVFNNMAGRDQKPEFQLFVRTLAITIHRGVQHGVLSERIALYLCRELWQGRYAL